MKWFKRLKHIFNTVAQGLPAKRYALTTEQYEDSYYKLLHCHTVVVLTGCHYSPKLGEYVYWCRPASNLEDDMLIMPVPESYIGDHLAFEDLGYFLAESDF